MEVKLSQLENIDDITKLRETVESLLDRNEGDETVILAFMTAHIRLHNKLGELIPEILEKYDWEVKMMVDRYALELYHKNHCD